MQHEKLYNLQTEVYFNCILFVYEKGKILRDQFSPLLKKSSFYTYENSFFLVYLFITYYVFSRKIKIYHKMQCGKLYNSQRTVYFICVIFKFKITPNFVRSVFATVKLCRTEFCFFSETKST
jgi:hypothetical protein